MKEHEFLEALYQSIDTTEKLKAKTNEELGRLLFDFVWSDLQILTPQSDLIAEVIKRLGYQPEDFVMG